MACPYFRPVRVLGSAGWNPAPRLPLIDFWAGVCCAAGAGDPSEDVQREMCNCGYARGRCAQFPAEAAADAARFTLCGERLIYVLEKDHAPVEHGSVASPDELREPLASQARAFLESWGRTEPRAATAAE